MLQFFRDGFYRDFIVLMLVTIIVGTVFSSGIAWAVDSYFGDTITDLIGDTGEYDLILHVREEAKDSALRELERITEQHFPGAQLDQTITVAGQSNILFGFAPEDRTKETFSSLPSIFTGVPGLNSYSVIVEPSVLVRGVHPSMQGTLQDRFNELAGVSFSFKDGMNILIVLNSLDDYQIVKDEVESILNDYDILELRFPLGFAVDTQEIANQVMELLDKDFKPKSLLNVSSAEYGEDLDAFMKTLIEMRGFLLSFASKVQLTAEPNTHFVVGEQIVIQGTSEEQPQPGNRVSESHVVVEIIDVHGSHADAMIISGAITAVTDKLVQTGYRRLSGDEIGLAVAEVEVENERYRLNYAINESLRLLEELDELAIEAAFAVDNADAVLNTFQEALMQLEIVQLQMQQLNKGIAESGAQSASEQLIISLFLNGLINNLIQVELGDDSEASLESLENIDIESMRLSLTNIAEQINSVQDIDVQAIIDQIGDIGDNLPQLDDEEIGKSINLIDNYLGGQVIPGERVQILVEGAPIDDKKLESLIRVELNNDYVNAYSTAVGMINPDARTEVIRVLQEIRATIAGILAIIFVMIILILDQATIFSVIKFTRSKQKVSTVIFSGVVGMVMLVAVYMLSGANIPFVTPTIIGLVGLFLGGLIGLLSEKFSPVNSQEIMAGQALGLSNVQIMHEIVVPASRPGLLNLLNRRKQRF